LSPEESMKEKKGPSGFHSRKKQKQKKKKKKKKNIDLGKKISI
jgi:hypothetical protein